MRACSNPAPPTPRCLPLAHLLFSTVSFSFKFWKYCRIALACCRWYSIVTPLQGRGVVGGLHAISGRRHDVVQPRMQRRDTACLPSRALDSVPTWRLTRGLLLLRGHAPPRAPLLLLLPAPRRRAAPRAAPRASAAAGRTRPVPPPPPAGAPCAAGRGVEGGTGCSDSQARGWEDAGARRACRRLRQRWCAAAAHRPAGAHTTPDAPPGWSCGRPGSLQGRRGQGRREVSGAERARKNHQPAGPTAGHKRLTSAAECQAHGGRGCKRRSAGARRARECWGSLPVAWRSSGGMVVGMQRPGALLEAFTRPSGERSRRCSAWACGGQGAPGLH